MRTISGRAYALASLLAMSGVGCVGGNEPSDDGGAPAEAGGADMEADGDGALVDGISVDGSDGADLAPGDAASQDAIGADETSLDSAVSDSGDGGLEAETAADAGTALDATVTALALPIDFGLVPCGTSTALPVSLQNAGPQSVTMHVAVTGAAFSVSPADVTIAPGGAADVVVAVSVASGLTAGVPLEGSLLTTRDDGTPPQEAPLRVMPYGATLAFAAGLPTEANFGAWKVGTAATPAHLVLRNVGNAPTSVDLGIPTAPVFTIAPDASSIVLSQAPSGGASSATIEVGFTPSTVGQWQTAVTLTAHGALCGSGITSFPVSGEGAVGLVYGWPAPDLDLGLTPCGTAPTGSFTLANDGAADVSLTSVVFDQPGYSASVGPGAVVPAQGTLTVSVTGAPIPFPSPIPATYQSTLTIGTDVPGDALHTTVVFAEARGAVVQLASAASPFGFFGIVPIGTSSVQMFTLANVGNADMTDFQATTTGPFSVSVFSNSDFPAATPANGELTFQPSSAGATAGTLAFSTTGVLCAPLPSFALAGAGPQDGILVSAAATAMLSDCSGILPDTSTTFTITNAGFDTAHWATTLTPNPAGFLLVPSSGDLGTGATVTVTVTSTHSPTVPSLPMQVADTVTVTATFSGDAGAVEAEAGTPLTSSGTVPLIGEAFGSCFFSGTPQPVYDLGDVTLGQSASITVGVPEVSCDNGSRDLTLSSPQSGPFSAGDLLLTPGYSITFTPVTAGPASQGFGFVSRSGTFETECGNANLNFTVLGNGVP